MGHYGETALIMATAYVRSAIVELLLNHPQIDVNVQNHEGSSALIFAASRNNATLVKVLANHPNIWINQANNWGETALWHACKYSQVTRGLAARNLLNHPNIDVNRADKDNRSPIFQAVEKGNGEALGALLGHKNIVVTFYDNNRNTPLIWAIYINGDADSDAAITLIQDGRTHICHVSHIGSAACVARKHGRWTVMHLLKAYGAFCCIRLVEPFCILNKKCYHYL